MTYKVIKIKNTYYDIKFLCSGGQVFVHSEKSNLIRRRPFHDQFIINDLNELFADTCIVIWDIRHDLTRDIQTVFNIARICQS